MAQVAEGAKTAGATRIIGVDLDATKFERGEALRASCLPLSPSGGLKNTFFSAEVLDALSFLLLFLHVVCFLGPHSVAWQYVIRNSRLDILTS